MTSQYLLDTNICIEIARGRYPGIQKRMAALSYGEVAICSIIWAEVVWLPAKLDRPMRIANQQDVIETLRPACWSWRTGCASCRWWNWLRNWMRRGG